MFNQFGFYQAAVLM